MSFKDLPSLREQEQLIIDVVDAFGTGATENPPSWIEGTPMYIEAGCHLYFQSESYKRRTLLAVRYGVDQGISIRTSASDHKQYPAGTKPNWNRSARFGYKARLLRHCQVAGIPVSMVSKLNPRKAQEMELVRLLGESY